MTIGGGVGIYLMLMNFEKLLGVNQIYKKSVVNQQAREKETIPTINAKTTSLILIPYPKESILLIQTYMALLRDERSS